MESKAVEVYPSDGSVIRSVGSSEHHYVHYWFNSSTRQVNIKHTRLFITIYVFNQSITGRFNVA